MFGGVECDDPNWVAVLAGHQIGDGGFEIGLIDIGFRKCGVQVSRIVDDGINGLIVAATLRRENLPVPVVVFSAQRWRFLLAKIIASAMAGMTISAPARISSGEIPP
jgi:hypothetical protein